MPPASDPVIVPGPVRPEEFVTESSWSRTTIGKRSVDANVLVRMGWAKLRAIERRPRSSPRNRLFGRHQQRTASK
jgi:hypothetical protein